MEYKNYATREELLEKELKIQKDMNALHEKNSNKIDIVNSKVDDLKDLVLPLVESSKATAVNTEKMAKSMDSFIEKQSQTNANLYNQINNHREILAERKGLITASKKAGNNERLEEKKMKNTTKGLLITGIVAIITTLIGVAPAIASLLFG